MLVLLFLFSGFFTSLINYSLVKKIIVFSIMALFSFLFSFFYNYNISDTNINYFLLGTLEEIIKISIPIIFYYFYKYKKLSFSFLDFSKIYLISAFSFAVIENYLYFYNFSFSQDISNNVYYNRLLIATSLHIFIPLAFLNIIKYFNISKLTDLFVIFISFSFIHGVYNISLDYNILIATLIFFGTIGLLFNNKLLFRDEKYHSFKYLKNTIIFGTLTFILLINFSTINFIGGDGYKNGIEIVKEYIYFSGQ